MTTPRSYRSSASQSYLSSFAMQTYVRRASVVIWSQFKYRQTATRVKDTLYNFYNSPTKTCPSKSAPFSAHISHHFWRIYVWKVPIVLPREFEYRQMRVEAFELAEASVSRSECVLKLFSREKAIANLHLFDYLARFTTVRCLSLHNSSLFREMSDRRKARLLCVATFRIQESERKSVSRVFRVSFDDKGFRVPYLLARLIF